MSYTNVTSVLDSALGRLRKFSNGPLSELQVTQLGTAMREVQAVREHMDVIRKNLAEIIDSLTDRSEHESTEEQPNVQRHP